MTEPGHPEPNAIPEVPEEDYPGIFRRVGRSLVAGVVASAVLWVLKLSRDQVPQLDTIHFLDQVADATGKATGLPDPLMVGWIWHWVVGTLLWGTLFGIMWPILPGRSFWTKGAVFGVITGLLVMLLVMPLAGAGYFGMELSVWDPVVSLVYHIIYGTTLAGVYALLARR